MVTTTLTELVYLVDTTCVVHKITLHEEPVPCIVCGSRPDVYCTQCEENMCHGCASNIHKMKMYRSHPESFEMPRMRAKPAERRKTPLRVPRTSSSPQLSRASPTPRIKLRYCDSTGCPSLAVYRCTQCEHPGRKDPMNLCVEHERSMHACFPAHKPEFLPNNTRSPSPRARSMPSLGQSTAAPSRGGMRRGTDSD